MKTLDTSVLVDHLRGFPPAVELLRELLEAGEPMVTSELVRFELLAGARDDELPALEELFSVFTWIPVGEDVARTAGLLARKHRKAHTGIDDADYLIGATGLVMDAELMTTNVRHFPMLADLRAPY